MGLLFLVVDDDELSRELLALLLGAEGYAVEVAASGEEALDRLGAGGAMPYVVLSDMQMPGICGSALAVALRGACGANTRLIAMSGSQPAGEALRGFDGFLMKPFAMEDLDRELARAPEEFHSGVADAGECGSDTASEVPALNEDIYRKMAKMMPGPQLGELYAMCLADARKRLGQLSEMAKAGDDEGYRRAAHTVKGGCGMIGATQLYALAEAAERDGLGAVTGGHPGPAVGTTRVTTLLDRFSSACDRLERILGKRKQENPVPAPGE